MRQAIARVWWLFVLRGVLAVLFGVLAFAAPGVTALLLVTFFGAYVLVDGVASVFQAFSVRNETDTWWLLLLMGLLGIAVGVLTFLNPSATALVLVLYVGAWALVEGVLQIAFAIRYRKEIEGEGWIAVGGVITTIFGLVLFASPGVGVLSVVWLIASYAVIFGLFMIVLGVRTRSLGKTA